MIMRFSTKSFLSVSSGIFSGALVLVLASCSLSKGGVAQSQPGAQQSQTSVEDTSLKVVELLYLKEEGGGMTAANEYFEWLAPIAERFDVEFDATYLPQEVLTGSIEKPDFILVYTFPTPETAQAVQTDPEYAANISNRNQIFDFDSGSRVVFRVSDF